MHFVRKLLVPKLTFMTEVDCTDIVYVPKVTVPILTLNVPKLAVPKKHVPKVYVPKLSCTESDVSPGRMLMCGRADLQILEWV